MRRPPRIPHQCPHRPGAAVPINLLLDGEAARLLRLLAPSPKTQGRLLSRLVYEHTAQQRAYQGMQRALQPLLTLLRPEAEAQEDACRSTTLHMQPDSTAPMLSIVLNVEGEAVLRLRELAADRRMQGRLLGQLLRDYARRPETTDEVSEGIANA